jgi:ABC-type phosphate/phosphonate transport system substrate-binding protein
MNARTLPLAALLVAVAVPARAAPREIVVASEALVAGGKYVPANAEAFARRLEEVTGWPKGALKVTAFARPREALEYIRKNKVPFAILPAHQFLEGRASLKLEVLGRAVGVEGTKGGYWGVTRNEKRTYEHIEDQPGLRLALTEGYDEQWLRLLMEGNVAAPSTHFKIQEVPTGADAVATVLARKADVALISETDFAPVKPRLTAKGDLAWVYASGTVPPPAVVAVGKFASAADRKRLTGALDKICKTTGADACARMAILYVEPGRAETYKVVMQKYERYRATN